MLPLRLVKTPHKILSMSLTIKFKQFLTGKGTKKIRKREVFEINAVIVSALDGRFLPR